MSGTHSKASSVNVNQSPTKNNKGRTKITKKNGQPSEESTIPQNSKRAATTNSKSKNKRQRVLAADAYWCISNVTTLNLKVFANNQSYFERRRCHSRYKTIILNYISEPDKYRLLEDFENWCHTVDCTEF